MNYLGAIRGTRLRLALLIAGGLFTSLVLAQESKQVKTDWGQVREAFDAYFFSPTEENALRVLSALPDRIDEKTMDFGAMNATIERIHRDHIGTIGKYIREGDRLALRIAYHLHKFADGWDAESITAVIGFSIVAMPDKFLEETLLFRKSNPREMQWSLDGILYGFIDFDDFRPEVIRKVVNERINALESVERADLLEFRDDCLRRLREHLKTLRHQAPKQPDCKGPESVISKGPAF